jgi:hypothetical protein
LQNIEIRTSRGFHCSMQAGVRQYLAKVKN